MMKHRTTFAIAATIIGSLLLTACGGSTTETDNGEDATTTDQQSSQIPADFFVADAPADASRLIDVKGTAQQGDRVTFEARVGGRKAPFVDGRAVFAVVDPALPSCDEMEGDSCRTPWDYCCETPESLLANMATVQIVGDDGQPIAQSLQGTNGLEPLKTVVITGTVAQADESGVLVVNADSIHVRAN